MLGDMALDKKSLLLPNVGHACRSLFGPVDHDEVRQTLRKELAVLDERSRDQWNFDFVQELPLAGRWRYEPVTAVPEAYRMPQLSEFSVTVNMVRLLQGEEMASMGVRGAEEDVAGSDTEEAPTARLAPVGEEEQEEAPVGEEELRDASFADTTALLTTTATTSCVAPELPRASLPSQSSTATQTSPLKRKRQASITDFFTHKKPRTTENTAKSSSS